MTLLLYVSLFISYLCFVAGQSQCTTPAGKTGRCIGILSCKSLLKLTLSTPPADLDLLRNSFCGFEGQTPKVCCPPCTTPDGAEGACISILSCPHLTNLLGTRTTQDIQYLQRSRCEGKEMYSVCCGPPPAGQPTPTTTVKPAGKLSKCRLSALPPDPATECCGLDANGGGNRIFGGNSTAIDEYPWLAIIEYAKDNKLKLLCGGVLISGRYVLTAAHCVVGRRLHGATPVNVRLGEYDTSNAGNDCVEVEGGGQDCNSGAVSIPIEKTIPHPNYDPASELRRNDIALFRLGQLVEFSDFIRPICLPSADFTPTAEELTLFTSGWGAVSDEKSSSNIKLKVGLPYVSYEQCQPWYNIESRSVQLWEGQLCAGGVKGQDSCKGDSGGPLMRENGRLFELVGIVSFGPTPCGMDNVAGVYTKVLYYMPWIRSQIEQ